MSATATPTPTPATNPDDRAGRDRRAALETARVLQAELDARIDGEVRFDRTSRMLYSTDASNYQIEPIGVVVPKSIDDVQASIELASSHGVPIVARGGGSG
ncbi:MAG: FAD-binding oxidoreductase, partial [Thermomicrobiales bacterium]